MEANSEILSTELIARKRKQSILEDTVREVKDENFGFLKKLLITTSHRFKLGRMLAENRYVIPPHIMKNFDVLFEPRYKSFFLDEEGEETILKIPNANLLKDFAEETNNQIQERKIEYNPGRLETDEDDFY